MTDVYEKVPVFESSRWLLRFVEKKDAEDLLEVYGDKMALPFFNSDNCHGDNFYYPDLERMNKAIDFWLYSYKEKFFVRWSILDKLTSMAVGTIELFSRKAADAFNNCALLRLDVRSDLENACALSDIASLVVNDAKALFTSEKIITKIPIFALERRIAFEKLGFVKSEEALIGADGWKYRDYWVF